jgi:hypothetical protein
VLLPSRPGGRGGYFSPPGVADDPTELDHAVALATGEDLPAIRRRGFSLADPAEVDYDPEPFDPPPQVIDWDALVLRRNTPLFPVRKGGRLAMAGVR